MLSRADPLSSPKWPFSNAFSPTITPYTAIRKQTYRLPSMHRFLRHTRLERHVHLFLWVAFATFKHHCHVPLPPLPPGEVYQDVRVMVL